MTRMKNPTSCILCASMWDLYFVVVESDGLFMKRNRNHKWICLFLVMMVLISGMCLEKIPADSYFSCKQANTITKTNGIIHDVSAYRTETLSQREVLSSLKTAKRDFRRTQIRANYLSRLCILSAEQFPKNIQAKRVVEEDGLYCKETCSVAILCYIHNQDGEKA